MIKFNIGDIATFSNIFEIRRLEPREGQRCVVTHYLTEDELMEAGFDFPYCEIVFDDGMRACVDSNSLTLTGCLKTGDIAVIRSEGSPCVIKTILPTEGEFEDAKVEVLLESGEEKTICLIELVPANTVYSKLTDPDFMKWAKEEYDG